MVTKSWHNVVSNLMWDWQGLLIGWLVTCLFVDAVSLRWKRLLCLWVVISAIIHGAIFLWFPIAEKFTYMGITYMLPITIPWMAFVLWLFFWMLTKRNSISGNLPDLHLFDKAKEENG